MGIQRYSILVKLNRSFILTRLVYNINLFKRIILVFLSMHNRLQKSLGYCIAQVFTDVTAYLQLAPTQFAFFI